MTTSQNSFGFNTLSIYFAFGERAFYQTGNVFLWDVKNCEGVIPITICLLRRCQGRPVMDGKILQPAIPVQTNTSSSNTSQRKSDLGQLVPAINTLPLLGIEIFRRVGFCPRGHTSLLLKSKGLITKYKFQAVNFSL